MRKPLGIFWVLLGMTAVAAPVGRRGRWAFYFKDPNGDTIKVYAD